MREEREKEPDYPNPEPEPERRPEPEPTPWHDPGPPVRKVSLPPDSPSPAIPVESPEHPPQH